MNETLLSRVGRVFFPRLAPDQRHRRMFTIVLILSACLFSAGILSIWMISSGNIRLPSPRLGGVPDAIRNK